MDSDTFPGKLGDALDRLLLADCRRIYSPIAVVRMNVGYRGHD